MKLFKLRKQIAAGLFAAMIASGATLLASNEVYAAALDDETSSVATSSNADDPNAFTARIQDILDQYHHNRKAFLPNGGAQEQPAAPVTTNDPSNPPAADLQEEPVAPPAPVNLPAAPTLNDAMYSFDWQGTPIANSLYAVGKAAGKSIVVNGQLSGNVYTSLHDVTCRQALDYLSRSFNFNWMIDEDSNAIIISTADLMKQSQIFSVHYVSKDKIKGELAALGIDEKNIYANTETGTISVTGTPYQLQEAAKRIRNIDHPVSQCLVLAQLIEISHGRNLDLGMSYNLPTYSHTPSTTSTSSSSSSSDSSSTSFFGGNVIDKLTFSASSAASKALSNGKVIARPMVMMLNGEEGNVSFGDKVPIMSSTSTTSSTQVTVTYQDVGTNLKVTPVIDKDTGEISMKIDTEISTISQWITQGNTKAPQISSRHAMTSAHLRSGQSFVIGGLMNVTEMDNLSGIPGLIDLPLLVTMFSYHQKSKTYAEVYIMITPYIVTNDIDPQAILKRAGEHDAVYR